MPSLRTGLPLFAVLLAAAMLASTPTAHAQVTGTVVLGCEFLSASIDGNVNNIPNAVLASDVGAACNGLTAAEIDAIAGDCDGDNAAGEAAITASATCRTAENGIGDNDGKLEVSDFATIDLDANQIENSLLGVRFFTYVFAFVDNDGTVTFDSQAGLTVAVNPDGGAATDPVAPASDGNSETCGAGEGLDFDCGTTILSNGDGVVVATLTDGTALAGASINVDISQGSNVSTETISVTGPGSTVLMAALKDTIQISGNANAVQTCKDTSDVSDGVAQLADVNRTVVKATVTDSDDVELTRVVVVFTTNGATIGTFDGIGATPDSGEPSSEVKSFTAISVASETAGSGSFAVICGGTTTGVAAISAKINPAALSEDTDFVNIAVVGLAAQVQVQSNPTQFVCDGVNTSTITATVRDAGGALVANGTHVNFSVTSVGIVNPINTTTVSGIASTTFTGFSGFSVGVPVVVTAGSAQSSTLIQCIGFDTDGDGMPNVFEAAHVCLNQAVADATGDPDVDAVASLSEYQRALNPCVADSDADGCEDGAEIAPNPLFGGDRDPLNPWDFFDVTGDRAIDLADTLAILTKFGLLPGDAGYSALYDRYIPDPVNKPWRTAAATGNDLGIDLRDALVNLRSFGHSCAAPP